MISGSGELRASLMPGERVVSRFSNYVLTDTRLIRYHHLSVKFEYSLLQDIVVHRYHGFSLFPFYMLLATITLCATNTAIFAFSLISPLTFIGDMAISAFLAFVFAFSLRQYRKQCYLITGKDFRRSWKLLTFGSPKGIEFVDALCNSNGESVYKH